MDNENENERISKQSQSESQSSVSGNEEERGLIEEVEVEVRPVLYLLSSPPLLTQPNSVVIARADR